MAQPQLDTNFLNQLFIETHKKKLDAFAKNRAAKAVQAHIKNDGYEGWIAQATYYIYFNEPQSAIDLMNKMIAKYGYDKEWVNLLIIAYQSLGDLKQQIALSRKGLDILTESEEDARYYENFSTNLIMASLLFLDNSQTTQLALNFLPNYQKETMMNSIARHQSKLQEMEISLETYQKLVSITNQVINRYYHRGFKFEIELDSELDMAELVIIFDNITVEEASELNNEIDDAILQATLTDEKFGNEVRKITTRCTLAYHSEDEALLA